MIETNKVEPTRVTVALGYTVNMGNFESLRIDVSVADSARAGENAKTLTDRIYAFTEAQLIEKVNAVRDGMESDAS